MVVVGLTGGIGSGKSTVGQLLVARGAAVVDADVLAREAVAPGTPGLAAVVSRFGPGVLAADGSLDRRTMADVVFSDRVALDDLNAIVHPPVRAAIEARLAALDEAGSDGVVVLEIPLLVESGRSYGASMIVVVDCPEDVAVRRLVAGRGMEEADVRRRIAAQASRADRLAAADLVIDNGGSPQQLAAEVDRVWGLLDNPDTIGLS
jgi:dephospho-CoA kinase